MITSQLNMDNKTTFEYLVIILEKKEAWLLTMQHANSKS